jgi:ABC-type multidrug transport system fused ATPase/permease subunit
VGLIGKSGAGKTTLVDILLGLHSFDSGAIRINGRPIEDFGWDQWVDQVAYIPQHVFLVDGSVEANVAFGMPAESVDRAKVLEALEAAQLTDLVKRLDRGVDTSLGERGVRLSGGERQRIGLARAFYMDRQVLILDEATSALDSETERHITDVIRSVRGERTVIVIAHRLTTVRDCDMIHRLKDGRIVKSGSYEEVVGEQ